MTSVPEPREIAAEWEDLRTLDLVFVNQILATLGLEAGNPSVPDSITLTFGQAMQPILLGSPEVVARKIAELHSIPVKPVARVAMSRERAEELMQVLAKTLAQYDAAIERGRHARA